MLSAVLIVKNEEEMIEPCLESLKFCDEIVVIDDGSIDETLKIAQKYTDKIFTNPSGSKGFVEAVRKFGVTKAAGDWILIIDADERVTKELAQSIEENIKNNGDFAAFRLKRKNYYLGNNPWPQDDELLRLFKKKEIEDWEWKLHTSPDIKGKVGDLSGYLSHYTHRNLKQMLDKTIEWSKQEAQVRFDAGHPKMSWWRFPRPVLSAFLNYYIKQKGYKVGTAGLVESMYQAFSAFITYARLWELQNKASKV